MDEAPMRRGRGRRPAAEVRADILDAASRLLLDTGLAAITFERVAAKAGTSKMTLYKWWPSPGSLAYEAYSSSVEDTLTFPDTGDVMADLRSQLHAFVQLLGANTVVAELIGGAQSDPALAEDFRRSYTLPRRALAVDRLTRARETGQIDETVDLEAIVDQLWGACYHRLLLGGPTLDEAFVDTLVENLFNGVGPRAR